MIDNEAKQYHSEQYLSHVRDIKRVLSYKRERIGRMRSKLEPGAIIYNDKIKTSVSGDKIERLTIAVQELIEECIEQECLYIDELRVAIRAINSVSDYYAQEVLFMVYIDCLTIKEICAKLNISRTTAYSYKTRGLVKLYEFIPEVDKRDIPDAQN